MEKNEEIFKKKISSIGIDKTGVVLLHCSTEGYNKYMKEKKQEENCIVPREDGLKYCGLSGRLACRGIYFIWVNSDTEFIEDERLVTIHHETVHILNQYFVKKSI